MDHRYLFSFILLFISFNINAQSIQVNLEGAKQMPLYTVHIENHVEKEDNTSGNDSYIFIVVQRALERLELPTIDIVSADEEIIKTISGIKDDSIKIFYHHRDTSFSVDLDIYLTSESCSLQDSFSYSFVNERPEINDQTFLVNENSITGYEIGEIKAEDPDGDPLSYQIVSANPEGIVEVNSIGVLSISDSARLDFELHQAIKLVVEVSDGSLVKQAELNISVMDKNEAPVVEDVAFEFLENEKAGYEVGQLFAEDPEGDPLSFRISGGNEKGIFELEESSGKLILNQQTSEFDHELNIETSDGYFSTNFTVVISMLKVLGISAEKHGIRVFPNPVKSFLRIKHHHLKPTPFSISLWNVEGKEVPLSDNQTILSEGGIDFSALPSGIYILSITSKDKNTRFRISKF